MNTLRWICFYIIAAQVGLALILTAIWFLGESSERRQRRRIDEARREVERMRRKQAGI